MYYVYSLVDPINCIPFYIGKGKKNRAWSHLRGSANYNIDKLRYINNIRMLDHEPEVIFVEKNIQSSKVALELESYIIDKCRSFGIPLTNKDRVIPDRTGQIVTPEHRAKISAANKGQRNAYRTILDVEIVRKLYLIDKKKRDEVAKEMHVKKGVINRILRENNIYKQKKLFKSLII